MLLTSAYILAYTMYGFIAIVNVIFSFLVKRARDFFTCFLNVVIMVGLILSLIFFPIGGMIASFVWICIEIPARFYTFSKAKTQSDRVGQVLGIFLYTFIFFVFGWYIFFV